MNTKKIPNPRTPTSVRADIVTAILALGARQRARMIAGHHLYNKVDLRAWLDVAAERYLEAELEAEREAEREASAEPKLPVPPPPAAQQQAAPELPAAVDEPKIAAPPAPKSPWADKDPEDLNDPEDQDQDQDVPPAPKPVPPAEKTEDFEGVRIRVGRIHPRGGYVHWRSRREVLDEMSELGIPPEALHHPELMTDGHKPSATAYKRTEKLIVQVREARVRGEDPSKLWARWLPAAATARKARKAA